MGGLGVLGVALALIPGLGCGTAQPADTLLAGSTVPFVVNSILPEKGDIGGGTEVIISGAGFTEDTTVLFGQDPAASFAFASETVITVTTPPHAVGFVDVQLNKSGAAPLTIADGFEYIDPTALLSITDIDPVIGPDTGGTEITIKGTGFDSTTIPTFDNLTAFNIQLLSPTLLTCVTPPHASGAVDVGLTAFDNRSYTATDAFHYYTLGELPRVVGAISTSNTTVTVAFSKVMGDSAIEPSNYVIVQTNVNSEAAGLGVTSATFLGPDHTAVELTTLSQSLVEYQVTAVNVLDVAGNPMAAKQLVAGILVDPSSALFAGNGTTAGGLDSDGDGLSDDEEQKGWVVTIVLSNGTTETREVTSDPFLKDTDGDGLDDRQEQRRATDPRDKDTDADLIEDNDELNVFFSSPISQDTDADGLNDSSEITFFKTSPLHADTDGDGFDDSKEVIDLHRNPRIADLPIPQITVGDMRLQIDERYTYTDTEGQTVSSTSSSSSTLSQSQENKLATSDTLAISGQIELGAKFGTEETVSKDPSVTFSDELEVKATAGVEHTSQFSTESSYQTQQAYESSFEKTQEFNATSEVTREVVGASIDSNVTIKNAGEIAFSISNIELSVLQQGSDRSKFVPVATLLPASTLTTGDDAVFNLGPLDPERGPIIFSSRDVFPNLVEDLMRSPRGVIFKIANFDILDEFGRNRAFSSQEVVDRTAALTIDYGDGTVERYLVATNGSFDDKLFLGGKCNKYAANAGDACTSGLDCLDACTSGVGCPAVECAGDFVGGFDEFGKPKGVPLDYVLQDILELARNPQRYNAIVAGYDGVATTIASGDDQQAIPPATTGLDDRDIVVLDGQNEMLDTAPNNGNLLNPTLDDTKAKTFGYETSRTCNDKTLSRIAEPDFGGDGVASTPVLGDDVQTVAVGDSVSPGDVIVSAGPNGVIDSVQRGDDVTRGPGDICSTDSECPQNPTAPPGAACNGRETLVRFKNSKTGDPNRFWITLTSEQIPAGTDFGDILLRPGEALTLAFGQDVDRDGLFAVEEYLYGASDREKDTDMDQLGDFTEIRLGWNVRITGQDAKQVYPDPRLDDSDGDNVRDDIESRCKTDPRLRDSDDDGLDDDEELDCGFCCTSASGTDCADVPRFCNTDDDCAVVGVCCTDATGTDCDNSSLCDADGDCDSDTAYTTCNLDIFPTCVDSCEDICPSTGDFFPPYPPTHLDPRNPDTDGDSLLDGPEIELGADPLDPGDAENFIDSDDDGLPDAAENAVDSISIVLCNNTCSSSFDNSCQDGSSCAYGTDCDDCGPRTITRDIQSNILEGDSDFDGLPDLVERTIGTDPNEIDTDLDGLLDFDEFADFGSFLSLNFQYTGFVLSDSNSQKLDTDPASQDTDGDRLSDDFELLTGWRILVFGEEQMRNVMSSPLFSDTDLDGLTDEEEFLGENDTKPDSDGSNRDATDPTDPDTDGDTRTDSEEIGVSDPLRPDLAVTVRIAQLVNVSGPTDGSNNKNEWQFYIDVDSPAAGFNSRRILDTEKLLQIDSGLGTYDATCDEWLTDYTWFSIPLGNAAQESFGLPLGDVVIVSGRWTESDECNGPASSCSMPFQTTFTTDNLLSQGFVAQDIVLNQGDCSATIKLEVEAN